MYASVTLVYASVTLVYTDATMVCTDATVVYAGVTMVRHECTGGSSIAAQCYTIAHSADVLDHLDHSGP